MAILNTYSCPACNNSWRVCGGESRIMAGPIVTCVCSHCRNLSEVRVEEHRKDYSDELSAKACRKCKLTGGLAVWNSKKLCCPKCGREGMNFKPCTLFVD